MAYTTIAKVRASTGMNNVTQITDAYITSFIEYAEGLINSKVGKVYTLPLSPVPKLIQSLALHITIGYLFLDQYGEESEDTDKGWERRLKWCLDLLNDIATGKAQLFDDDGVGSDGSELDKNNLFRPSGYPTDASSEVTAEDTTAPKFTMNDVF